MAERTDAREALRTAVRRQAEPKVSSSTRETMTHEDADAGHEKKTRTVLNVPLLAGTLVAVALLGPALFAWRSYQVKRTATAFLDRADALEGQEDWANAANYLDRYLRLRPNDPDATDLRIRLTRIYDKSAEEEPRRKLRAVELYYQTLGVAPDDDKPALRRRLAELLLEVGRFASAEKEAESLLVTPQYENDPDGLRLLALSLYRQVGSGAFGANPNRGLSYQDAFERALKTVPDDVERAEELAKIWILSVDGVFERALEANPGNVELSTGLAHIYRNELQALSDEKQALDDAERAELADQVMDDMVAASLENQENSQDAEEEGSNMTKAFLARYAYRTRYKLAGADEDLTSALQHGPQDWTALFTAARRAFAQARTPRKDGAADDEVRPKYDEACDLYQRAVEVDPSRERAHLELGDVYLARGDVDLAVQTWKHGLERSDERSMSLNARLAEVLIRQRRLEDAKGHLDVLAEVADELALRLTRPQRVALQRSVDFLRAQWHTAKGEYREAIPLLRGVVTSDAGEEAEATQVYQAWRMLGGIYTLFAERDRAASAFEQAAALQPGAIQARLDVADAWMSAGRPDLAISHYDRALAVARDAKVDDTEIRFRLARARFLTQARLPKAQRAWGSFVRDLNGLKESMEESKGAATLREPWRLAVLEVQYLLVTASEDRSDSGAQAASNANVQEAKQLLDQAQKDFPDSTSLLQSLVSLYDAIGCPEDADRALAEYEKRLDEPGAACLLRSMLLTRRRQYEEARKALQEGMGQLPAQVRPAIEAQLVQVSLGEGQLARAEKELKALVTRRGKSATLTGLVCQLAEAALRKNELGVVKQCESDLRELEGAGGTNWRYYRARRLLAEAKTADQIKAATEEAEALCKQIQTERPEWGTGHFLSGLILERRRDYEGAIEAYKETVRLGERDISVYERLIPLVYLGQRYDEAHEYLSQLQDRGLSSPTMTALESGIAAGRGQLDLAIEKARQRVESQPENPWAHVWLGSLLLNASREAAADLAEQQKADAEAAFQEAVKLAPTDVRVRNALFDYYVRTDQLKRAEETIEEVRKLAELAPAARAFSVAEMYRRLNRLEDAESYYRTAEEALARQSEKGKPSPEVVASRVAVKKRLAELVARNDLEEATDLYKEICNLVPQSISARRNLAAVLALQSFGRYDEHGEQLWQEAQGLLSPTDAEADGSSVNQRLRAMLLAQRGGEENLAEARRILEQLVSNPQEVEDLDHLALAEIYKREAKLHRAKGNDEEAKRAVQAARGQFTALVARENPNASHLLMYVDFLLQNNLKGDSAQWRRKFEQTAADNPRLLRDYVDLLLAKGLKDEAQAALKKLDELAADSAELRSAQVELLLKHDMNEEAAASLDKLEALAPDSLDTTRLRARWLAARGEAAKIEPLVEAVADRLLKEAGEDGNQRAQMCFGIGAAYSAASQGELAQRWYRRGVELAPDAYGAVVVDLAKQGETTEAIRICNEAAKRDDPTRAAKALTLVLVEGRPTSEDYELAEPTLSRAIGEHEDDPELLFAVANARIQQGRIGDAVALYRAVLKLRPKNVIVLNNLATLLSESPDQRNEALRYIDQAIEIAGPQPALLDTKGTILIEMGRAQEAVRWLEEAVSGRAPDPRFHFHLAVAYHRVGKSEKAQESLQTARDGDLLGQILTDTDREWLAELERKFG